MTQIKESGELSAITRAFDLVREMTQRVGKLPRDVKFILGDRILTTSYDVLDTLIEAKYSRKKRDLLQKANLLLERLRFQVRLCVEEKLMSPRQYEYLARLIQEIGRMVGGWAKSLRE